MSNENLPRFHPGWTTANGKAKKGFWEIRHEGKYHALTKYGAPNENHSRKNTNAAIAARDRFLAEQGKAAYQAELTANIEANRVVTAGDVINLYIAERLPETGHDWQANLPRLLANSETSFAKLFGRMPAMDVSPATFGQWASHRSWGAGGRKNAIKMLLSAFNFAVQRRVIPSNPLRGLVAPRTQPRQTVFEAGEFDRLLAGCVEPEAREFFTAVLECPSRPGELATANREHVKVSPNGTVYIELPSDSWKNGKKTGKARVIPLTKKWQEWARQRAEEIDEGEPLFVRHDGRRWDKNSWANRFRAAKVAAGVNPELDCYSIRHTAITRAVLAGIPLAKVAVMFGTSVAQIEGTYSKYGRAVDDMAAMVELI